MRSWSHSSTALTRRWRPLSGRSGAGATRAEERRGVLLEELGLAAALRLNSSVRSIGAKGNKVEPHHRPRTHPPTFRAYRQIPIQSLPDAGLRLIASK